MKSEGIVFGQGIFLREGHSEKRHKKSSFEGLYPTSKNVATGLEQSNLTPLKFDSQLYLSQFNLDL